MTVHMQNLTETLIRFTRADGTHSDVVRHFVSEEEANYWARFHMAQKPHLRGYQILPWRAPANPETRRDVWYQSRVTGEPHRWEAGISAKAAELLISKLRVNGYEAWDTEVGA